MFPQADSLGISVILQRNDDNKGLLWVSLPYRAIFCLTHTQRERDLVGSMDQGYSQREREREMLGG